MLKKLPTRIHCVAFTGLSAKNKSRNFTCRSCSRGLQEYGPGEEKTRPPLSGAVNVKGVRKSFACPVDQVRTREDVEKLWESASQRHKSIKIIRRRISQLSVKNEDLDSAMVLYKACLALRIPIGPKTTNALVNSTYIQHISTLRNLFELLKASASDVDIQTCNSFVKQFLQFGHWNDAISVLEWAEMNSVLPGIQIYNYFITDSVKRGDLKQGESFLMQMRKKGIARDETSYKSFLRIKAENGTLIELERLFCEIVADCVQIGRHSWNLMLKGYLRHANRFGVVKVLQYMILDGHLPDEQSSAMIMSYAHKFSVKPGGFPQPLHGYKWEPEGPTELEQLYIVLKQNFGTTEIAKHSLASIKVKHRKLSISLSQAQGPLLARRAADVTRQLRVLMKAGDVQRSMEIFDSMFKSGSMPATQEVYAILLNGLLKYRKFRDAHGVLDMFRKTFGRPGIVLQTILLDRDPSTSAEHVKKTLTKIESSGATLDIVVLTSAAQKLFHGGELYGAVAMLSRALETLKMTIDMPAATVLLNIFDRLQSTEGITWVVRRILRDDVAVDKKFIDEFNKIIKESEEPRQAELQPLKALLWSQYPS